MHEYQKKKNWREYLYTKPILVLLVIATLIMLKATYGAYEKRNQSVENLARVNKELADLKQKTDLLSSDITKLQTKEGIEDEIRQKFRVIKGDEHLVVVVDPKDKDNSSQQANSSGFWSKIVNFFSTK